jgi:hypothetical protein
MWNVLPPHSASPTSAVGCEPRLHLTSQQRRTREAKRGRDQQVVPTGRKAGSECEVPSVAGAGLVRNGGRNTMAAERRGIATKDSGIHTEYNAVYAAHGTVPRAAAATRTLL